MRSQLDVVGIAEGEAGEYEQEEVEKFHFGGALLAGSRIEVSRWHSCVVNISRFRDRLGWATLRVAETLRSLLAGAT